MTPKKIKNEPQIALFHTKDAPDTFRKAVQVVHSKPLSSLSLLQRKMLNAWLKEAINTTHDSEGWWSIRIEKMSKDIGFNSKNRQYLKEAAEELMRIVFAWDVVTPQEKRVKWKASVLFPDVEISSDVIRFQIGAQLREHVLNPEIYALIDQAVLRKYRRAASAGIYEHCVRFEKIARTTLVPWQEFRDIVLGVSANKKTYEQYKAFKSKVLNPCVAEINAQGAIHIQLRETKAGKSVECVFFLVTKPKTELLLETKNNEITDELVGQMVKQGLMPSEARRLVNEYTEVDVRQALAYTNERRANKKAEKLENPGAYFRKALTQKWTKKSDVEDVEEKGAELPKVKLPNIPELFKLKQMSEAQKYFKVLDADDQSLTIERYNNQQETNSLKLKAKKTKATEAAFSLWLSKDLWGAPSADQMLAFAQTLLSEQQG